MPKVFLLDTGMRNDKGELWENSVFRLLADKYDIDAIQYWRTSAGNEIDFVLPAITNPRAIEAKYDKIKFKPHKYKLFTETYPEIPLENLWFFPFDADFFRRTHILTGTSDKS